MNKILLFVLFISNPLIFSGQDINSILNSKSDAKTKCDQLQKVAESSSISRNTDSLALVCHLMDSISKTTKDDKFISQTLRFYIDNVTRKKDDLALQLAYENLEVSKRSNDCKLISIAYVKIAGVQYWGIGNIEKGKEYYERAMQEAHKCGDKETMLKIYDQSENIYFNTGDYETNKQILLKEQALDPSLKNDAWHNTDFGDIYRALNKLDSADLYYLKAIQILEDKKDSTDIMQVYYNYALIPLERKDYKTAILYCKKGLAIEEKKNIKNTSGYHQLYSIYYQANDLVNAKKYLQEEISINEARNCKPCLIGNYRRMSELCYEEKDYKSAYEYLLKNNDLFFAQNNAETTANLTKVEEENLKKQKQLEIDLITQQKEAEKKIKSISFIALGVASILICGIAFSLFKIAKSRKVISTQKQEVELQKHLVEEKQKEIIDSIRYAQRIQTSLLPTEKYIDRFFRRKSK